ncbi:MAG: DegT/DnrJ/EryC1/StrS family aminotransferase [bacterium]|nr:DegT/DnrJ/EryC1/StrS family aminotransferase [bacterium]
MKFIPVAEPTLGGNEKKYVMDCINTTWISSLGKYIPEFEEKFSKYCGVKHGVAVSNGTTALHLALTALNIQPGDEVIIPDLTFVATANAVAYTGARPVFVDSELDTWNMDIHKIEEKITENTRAIIVVHLYGHPVDMDPVMKLAKDRGLLVIEDAAEAHGAEYKGKKVGRFSDVACFSFYGNKIITTGEGGMCVTNNEGLAKKMQFLKDHAMDPTRRYWHPMIGFNYRMTNIQAAIGLAQLENIGKIITAKRKNAALYNSLLDDSDVTLPPEADWAKNVYWMYSVLSEKRDQLMETLKKNKIDSRPFFSPIHQMPPYKSKETFHVADELAVTGLNLPSSVNLTKEDIERICGVINSVVENGG